MPPRGAHDRLRPAALARHARPVLRAVGSRLPHRFRPLPDFVIIGAQKAGTTALYEYLTSTPRVVHASTKEVHYFDGNWGRGTDWYRSHFSLLRRVRAATLTGEATPMLLFHPDAPRRVAATIPNARFIVALRDPVERAWSQYRMERARGTETLDIDDALDAEAERLAGAVDPDGTVVDLWTFDKCSYTTRGHYAEQLQRWFRTIPREQVHVVDTGHLFTTPAETVDRVLAWLGHRHSPSVPFVAHNEGVRLDLPPSTRARLEAHFAPHDDALWDLLGRRLSWAR